MRIKGKESAKKPGAFKTFHYLCTEITKNFIKEQ